MKLKIIYCILCIIIFSSCQRTQVVSTHGISYLENREKLIILNKSNKNDAITYLGFPATKGMTNNNLWIYLERTEVKGSIFKLGKKYLKKNNVLVLEFNNMGIVMNKKFYDKNKMNRIEFTENITENEIKKENFIYGFLSSVRQKMESRKQ